MARRDPVGIRLLTRNGYDWAARHPLIVEAVNHLRVRSVLIDGEVVCCDGQGQAVFKMLRHRKNEATAFLLTYLNWTARTYGGSRSKYAGQRWPAYCVKAH